MAVLPHPWDAYGALQAELNDKVQVDSEAWGLEEALNKLVDPATRKSATTPDAIKRVRNAAARRERHRAHVRILRVVQGGLFDSEVEDRAVETLEALAFVQAQVTLDDWQLLQQVAEGRAYADLAKGRGVSEVSLRVRVSRLRASLRRVA
jgi:hypothetical protein